MPSPALLASALLAVAMLAGCGDEEPPSPAPGAPASELAISVDPDGDGAEPALRAELTCPAASAPRGACEALERLPGDPAAPVPANTACTEIYGGADVLRLSGTLRGEPVEAELTRANGCEIERFERFAPLLGALFPDYEPGSELAG